MAIFNSYIILPEGRYEAPWDQPSEVPHFEVETCHEVSQMPSRVSEKKRTPSEPSKSGGRWIHGLMSYYFCLDQIWVMIQHDATWEGDGRRTSQPLNLRAYIMCIFFCLKQYCRPIQPLKTVGNERSISRVGWSNPAVGHPELPGGRLPFRAPHRCLWRQLFDQCWHPALDLLVGDRIFAGHRPLGVGRFFQSGEWL